MSALKTSFFQKSLNDIIKESRAPGINRSFFFDKCHKEIKREIKLADMDIKRKALLKLLFVN